MASRADWQKILRKTIKLENSEGRSPRGIEIKGILQTQATLRHREDDRELLLFLTNGTVETKTRLLRRLQN